MSDDDDLEHDGDLGEDEGLVLHSGPDVATRRGVRQQEKEALRRERQEREFWVACLDSDVGRRVLWKLFRDAKTFDVTFGCGPNGFPQPEASWFYAGARDFGLRLYQHLLHTAHEGIRKMHVENDPRWRDRSPEEGRP